MVSLTEIKGKFKEGDVFVFSQREVDYRHWSVKGFHSYVDLGDGKKREYTSYVPRDDVEILRKEKPDLIEVGVATSNTKIFLDSAQNTGIMRRLFGPGP